MLVRVLSSPEPVLASTKMPNYFGEVAGLDLDLVAVFGVDELGIGTTWRNFYELLKIKIVIFINFL